MMRQRKTTEERKMERQWERILIGGGLPAELDPIEEGSATDASEVEAKWIDEAAGRPVELTAIERRIVERIKALGWVATLEEANSTDEQIERLADSGAAFLRVTDLGDVVLAMASATDADVRRAAGRIYRPEVRKFSPRPGRPRTSAVMFLDHHTDRKVPGEEAEVRAAEEFRNSCRVAVAQDVLGAHGGRLTKQAKVELANRLFGETTRRAREGGQALDEAAKREIRRALARAASEALRRRTEGRRSSRDVARPPVESAELITARWRTRVEARNETG